MNRFQLLFTITLSIGVSYREGPDAEVLFTILHRRDAEGIKFAVVFPRNTTVRWKRRERIGACPVYGMGELPMR
jgi:hypothetical protein